MMLSLIKSKINNKEFINIKHLLSSYVLKYSIGLIINIWIVRNLGENNFGIFNYVNSLNGIFGIISTFGLQTVVVTNLMITNLEDQRKILSNSFILSLLTGFLAAILQLGFIFYYNFNERVVVILCLINIFIYLFDTFKILTFYYESIVESKSVSTINNISFLICTLFRVVILYYNLGLYYIAFSYVLDYLFTALFLYIKIPKSLFTFKSITFNKKIFLSILKESKPFLFSGLFISFFMKIDIVLIKNLMNNHEAGIFSASVRLTEIWYIIPGVIQSSFFPSLFENITNEIEYKRKMIKLYKLMIYFSLVIILTTILIGKYMVIKLFGIEFTSAYDLLKVHIWSILFVSISVIRNSYLFAHKHSYIFFQISVIGAISNLVLCYIFIKYFGAIGASFATVISYFIVGYISNFLFKPLRSELENINYSIKTLFTRLNK